MSILIADDSPVVRQILKSHLREWGYDVVEASAGDEALSILRRKDAPRFAILDWLMPGMDGVEVCRNVRESANGPYCYILMLTSKDDCESIVQGLEAGADDFITKPFDPDELRQRLRAGQRILDLQDRLLHTQETLHYQATHDSLTGIWNRHAIMEILDREIQRLARDDLSVGIVLADIDHFKKVNDTYGHQIGDALLSEIAQRMSSSLREYDSVGRYGGEEFLIIVPSADIDITGRVAERLRDRIQHQPMEAHGDTFRVTISMGAATSQQLNHLTAEALIRLADEALYQAKDGGRDCVRTAEHRIAPVVPTHGGLPPILSPSDHPLCQPFDANPG